jgi:PAS domain S-box-containing protein
MTANGRQMTEGAEHRVLVVDDEPQILAAIQDLLEDEFSVLTLADGETALRLLAAQEVGVILSDQRMPGLNGDQFLREAQKRSRATRVLITGYTDLPALIRAVNEGKIYGYLAKPWEPAELKSLVSKAADHFKLLRELEQERDLLRALMDHAPDAIYFKDADFRFIRVNQTQADLLGLNDPAAAVGKTEADFRAAAQAEASHRDEVEVLTSGQPLLDKTENMESAGGPARWFSTTKAAIKDRGGRIIGTLGIAREVTERKRLEQQLLQAQKMEAVGGLAGGIAHDFNNMLTSIMGFAELALHKEPLPAPVRECLAEINKQGERAAGLVGQLLAFSRRAVTEKQPLNLLVFLKELRKMLERTLPETIALELKVPSQVALVKADLTQIQQVMLNLCLNASHAMPQGGQLLLRLAEVDLDEVYCQQYPYARPGRYLCLSVQDTGVGMPPEVQARIFEPFFTTKEAGTGTGLGLAMVYGIVKAHEGHINVYSEVGQGSEFKVYLPAIEGSAPRPAAPVPETPARGSETLLLVEDQEAVLTVCQRMLAELGYTVLTATNGVEAFKIYAPRQDEIALVISDMVMPKMGGQELYEILAQVNPQVKMLLMSGYSGLGEQVAEWRRKGLKGFVQKPIDFKRLGQLVRQALDEPEPASRRAP